MARPQVARGDVADFAIGSFRRYRDDLTDSSGSSGEFSDCFSVITKVGTNREESTDVLTIRLVSVASAW